MTIGFVIFSTVVHGAQKRVIKMALSSNNKFFNSYLILNQNLYEQALLDSELNNIINNNKDNIKIVRDSFFSIPFLGNFLILFKLILIGRKIKCDFFHSFLSARYISSFLTFFRYKVVIELASPDAGIDLVNKYPKFKFLFKRLYKINCVTKTVYDIVMNKMPSSANLRNITYMDLPFTDVDTISNNQFKEKENTIIYASRFIERKNVVLFAETIKKIITAYPEWTVKILGSGPLEHKLKTILKEEITNKQVSICYSSTIISDFLKSKIIVSYIYPDNYPSQSLFEAMACGNAVIVSNNGLSYKFVQGKNGLISEKDSYHKDIEYLMRNNDELENMMRNSVDFYKDQFDVNNYFFQLKQRCYE